jgi:cytochrome c oxidase subunit 2
MGMLEPAGPGAAAIADLTIILVIYATVLFAFVVTLLAIAILRRREASTTDGEIPPPLLPGRTEERRAAGWVALLGIVIPISVVWSLFVLAMGTMDDLEAKGTADVVIEVEGRQYWWDIRYLDEQGNVRFRTANEVHVPVGREIELRLTSADVIHSVWAPRITGKLDMIPGRETVMRFRVDETGVFRGVCAEYCGLQHTRMAFLVVAEDEPTYDAWIARNAAPAVEPDTGAAAAGRTVFASSQCASCHTVRGVNSGATLGPDLTHLAGRRTLGAATLANNRGNLGGWITDPQGIKSGALMPPSTLNPDSLRALLAYLESLR